MTSIVREILVRASGCMRSGRSISWRTWIGSLLAILLISSIATALAVALPTGQRADAAGAAPAVAVSGDEADSPGSPTYGSEIATFAAYDRERSTKEGLPSSPFASTIEQWRPTVVKALGNNTSLPVDFILAIIEQESNGDPKAVGSAGKIGLMQLTPANFAKYGSGDAYDPETNIRAGIGYLTDVMQAMDGNLLWTVTGYNAGIDNARQWRRSYGFVPSDVDSGQLYSYVNYVCYSYLQHRPSAHS